ncbi:hypothetical protein N7457_000039 [Penicillium paradoxum]|uniref:uncharacterized protein n=1 Tax=Penicillium paradoxum TaxID=176176 RepID=UPI002549BDE4|nr:uncharacterized protein N7457_000039 [Penicillium paradoxum]KAJ5793440.1 hypothetical protein N7457_000039 [Penicillium paradoxum]
MKFTAVLLVFATACGAEHHRRATTDNGIDLVAITSALEHLVASQTASANFGNISPPPKSLIPEILSVVPVSVVWELINPPERSALASQFKAGSTPAWYSALPSGVKRLADSKATAANTAATATATDGNSESGRASSSSSTDAAAQATGLTVSAMGALGVLGLALAL